MDELKPQAELAGHFDEDGIQFLIELRGYKRGLDSMFRAFTIAMKQGYDLKTALGDIAKWFDTDFNKVVKAANEYLDQPACPLGNRKVSAGPGGYWPAGRLCRMNWPDPFRAIKQEVKTDGNQDV